MRVCSAESISRFRSASCFSSLERGIAGSPQLVVSVDTNCRPASVDLWLCARGGHYTLISGAEAFEQQWVQSIGGRQSHDRKYVSTPRQSNFSTRLGMHCQRSPG